MSGVGDVSKKKGGGMVEGIPKTLGFAETNSFPRVRGVKYGPVMHIDRKLNDSGDQRLNIFGA